MNSNPSNYHDYINPNTTAEGRERLIKYLSDNIALFDCQDSCPDEVALNEDLRTPEYCDKCFANQIITLVKNARYVSRKSKAESEPDIVNSGMTIDEALYELEAIKNNLWHRGRKDKYWGDAVSLGMEALKRYQSYQSYGDTHSGLLLPGEAEG